MKITDYGLWFGNWKADEFGKMSKYCKDHIYINGKYIGCLFFFDGGLCFAVQLEYLNESGFKINPKSSGERKWSWCYFPKGYIPSESDFEEIE